jgi:protein disulfide-isomerase
MKKLILMAMVAGGLALAASAAELQWLTDLPKAQAKAKAENKLVLMDFTGSDWCSWCVKLDKEVFSKPEFVAYAKKNLVLVYVDFPRKKALPPKQKEANDALKATYKVSGFPTLIGLNSKGDKVFEQVGYLEGVQNWISKLDAAKKK